MLKVLIADDDFGMRKVLRKILGKREEFEIVAEAENGLVALELFEEYVPDIVFLDVEMPYLDGIGCATKIFDINPKTIIIFATGHEGFMSQAFQVYAFDYLMKPFDMERMNSTLDRIVDIKQGKIEPIKETKIINNSVSKLIIKNKDGLSFVNYDDVVMIQREDRNTVIYTAKDKFFTSESLGSIEEKLKEDVFMRSHKSYIINTSKISNIYPYGRWTYTVKFQGCKFDALMTHKKYENLEEIFNI